MKKFDNETVSLTDIPADIDLQRIQCNKNQCQDNAYKTSRDYDYGYVEGVVILIDKNNSGKAAAHAWNESKAGHFDVTSTLWNGAEYAEVAEIKYFPVISYESDEMPQGGKKWSAETLKQVNFYNTVLPWKFKPDDEVVLKDANSGKAVAHAIINWFDPKTKIYNVTILRLKNQFQTQWLEKNITKATPELLAKVASNLAEVEQASDLMVSDYDTKDQPLDKIVQFTIDVPPYLVYYKQLDIDGAIFWRLLLMESVPGKK